MSEQLNAWVDSSDILRLFPTLVWKLQIKAAVCAEMNQRLLALIETLHADADQHDSGLSWQSARNLHEQESLGELVRCIETAAQTVVRFLRISHDAFELTGCWANVLPKGAAHKTHSHPNNFLSGVYYLRTPDGADTINFHDPRNQTGIIRPPVTELTAENTDQVVVKVGSGTLLLFPSYLQHDVHSNNSDSERISISFNLMFSSYVQQMSKPLW